MSKINSKFKILNSKVKIIENKKVKKNYFKMVISSYFMARYASPGQFVSIKITDSYEPLLRRPFSIHRVQKGNIEILYEVVGKGTQIMSKKREKEYLDIIGPLGKGFDLKSNLYRRPILVGGGMGVAPLLFLAEKLAQNSKFKTQKEPLVLLGAKTKDDLLCEKDFKDLKCKVELSTEDGSRGFRGKVTDLLKYLLSNININCRLSTIYACGPYLMLKEIAYISKEFNIPAQVSLERHFACGIGVCFGCSINTKTGPKRICKDGPVFKTEDIIW